MFEVNVKIIAELKAFLCRCTTQTNLLSAMRNSDTAFTRNRKLSFTRLVLFICKLCKKTLSDELDAFFEQDLQCPYTCSVSAYSLQRRKLSFAFFVLWNEVLCNSFYHYGAEAGKISRWRGRRLIAVDGSRLSLVATKELYPFFGGQSNRFGSYCGAQTIVMFDVLNKLFIYSRLAPYRVAEKQLGWQAIDALTTDMIAIYDRNFASYKTIALLLWSEQQPGFVIRAQLHHNSTQTFLATGLDSQVVQLCPDLPAIGRMRAAGFVVTKKTALTVRLVRVVLEDGGIEVLITNLMETQGYTVADLSELYGKRWGVETGIGTAKNLLELESMSGQTVESVHQDFYATIVMTNLSALIARQGTEAMAQARGQSARQYKHQVQANMNKCSGAVRHRLVDLFIAAEPDEILAALEQYNCRHHLPIRPGRRFEHIVKNKQTKSKHKTYTNYKRAA